jgi:hypothetical protein
MGVLSELDTSSLGIVPCSLEYIFNSLGEMKDEGLIQDYKVQISFIQIYLEQVSDLLNPENGNMSIREQNGEVYIENLLEVPVQDFEQAMNIVNAGLRHRIMAS